MDTAMNIRSVFLILSACILSFAFRVPVSLAQVPSDRETLLSGGESAPERPAELGGYPGPGRVLELEKELQLTDAQKKTLRSVADEMRLRAIELGKRIVGVEEELNDAFRTGLVSEQSVRDDAEQIGRLRGKLRAVHLTARLKTRRILTPEQLTTLRNIKSKEPATKR
jgi:Spy/CpxP family protein refolding chaperone